MTDEPTDRQQAAAAALEGAIAEYRASHGAVPADSDWVLVLAEPADSGRSVDVVRPGTPRHSVQDLLVDALDVMHSEPEPD